MKKKDIKTIAKKFGGWWDGDILRFPCPHDKDCFLRELSEGENKK